MTRPKFIQIHFLSGWPAVLLNRDDAGLAKRLPFGGVVRTRVSSQCLKRHWRMADDPRALHQMAGNVASERSKVAVERSVVGPLSGEFPEDVLRAIEKVFIEKLYGSKAGDLKSRQALLLGRPELNYLHENARRIATEAKDAKDAEACAKAWFDKGDDKTNLRQLREQNALSAGLEAALFGRMVTSDPRANTDAAIHVAHAFTVHEEQPELDYFTVVDDLRDREQGDDAGAAGVFDTELTSGLYYGYVVVDLPLLVSNLTGCTRENWADGDTDRDMAGRVVENLIHLIAEISPGAKKGSTAPYSRAELLLVEAGERQPRTLANAFRDPVPLTRGDNVGLSRRAANALAAELADIDDMYSAHEMRRHAARSTTTLDGIERLTVPELAAWAGASVRGASA